MPARRVDLLMLKTSLPQLSLTNLGQMYIGWAEKNLKLWRICLIFVLVASHGELRGCGSYQSVWSVTCQCGIFWVGVFILVTKLFHVSMNTHWNSFLEMLSTLLLMLTLVLMPSLVSAAIFPADLLVKMLDAKSFKKALKANVSSWIFIRKFGKSWFSQMVFMIQSQYYTVSTTAHNPLHACCRFTMVL